MRLITDRPLTFWGTQYGPGEEFECDDEKIARELLTHPGISRAETPTVIFETKPAKIETKDENEGTEEVKPETGETFPGGDVPVPDQEQAGVDPKGDQGVPGTDVSEQGTSNRSGRGKRSRPTSL